MPIQAPISTVIPKDQRSPLDLRTSLSGVAAPIRQAFERVQNAHDALYRQMRTPQNVEEFVVTDPSGAMVFWAGSRVVDNQLFRGFWSREGYLGGTSPLDAPLYANEDGVITFTLGGSDDAAAIVVLNEDGDEVVRIGKINDTPDEYGIYARSFKFGGPDVDNPIIFGDKEGLVTMEGATIRLGPGTDGNGGVIEVYDAAGDLIATFGMYDGAAGVAVTSTNAGSITNGAAHGLVPGDFARITGNSNADHNRIWPVVTTPTSTTWTTTGMIGSGTGGSCFKQSAGGWSRTFSIGGADPANAVVTTDEDGNVVINGATITVTTTGGENIIIDPSRQGIEIEDSSGVTRWSMDGGGLLGNYIDGTNAIIINNLSKAIQMFDGGSEKVFLSATAGGQRVRVEGVTVIDSSRNGFFTNIYTKTQVDAMIPSMTNYYTKSEVDTLLFGKSDIGHTHTVTGTINSANVASTPSSHNHTFSLTTV